MVGGGFWALRFDEVCVRWWIFACASGLRDFRADAAMVIAWRVLGAGVRGSGFGDIWLLAKGLVVGSELVDMSGWRSGLKQLIS